MTNQKTRKKMIDYFPNLDSNGAIFTAITAIGDKVPWSQYTDGKDMDFAYLYHRSGIKPISDFFLVMTENGVVNLPRMANILFTIYGQNWIRLWNDFQSEYQPFDNYKYNEVHHTVRNDVLTIVGKVTDAGSDSTEYGSTNTETRNMIDSTDYGHKTVNESTQNAGRYGFNGPADVPITTNQGNGSDTESGTDTLTMTGTDTNAKSGTDTTTSNNTSERNDTHTNKDDDTTTITRNGLSGQSYQDILTAEFALWKWNYFEQVFADVDEYLTLKVYDPCASLVDDGGEIYY